MNNDLLEAMVSAALEGGKVVRAYFRSKNLRVVQKSVSYDLVTIADHEAQEAIVSVLQSTFPHIPIVEEEGGRLASHSRAFYVDPLDGTFNFARGIPFFAVSLGYWEDDRPWVGVVYDPLREDVFTARAGEGAFWNNERVWVSDVVSVEGSVLVTGVPYAQKTFPRVIEDLRVIIRHTDIRVLGSASLNLCYLAAGIIDGYWEYALSPWDLAAGVLIAREAGAIVTHPSGKPFSLFLGDVLAANPNIYPKLLALLQESADRVSDFLGEP